MSQLQVKHPIVCVEYNTQRTGWYLRVGGIPLRRNGFFDNSIRYFEFKDDAIDWAQKRGLIPKDSTE